MASFRAHLDELRTLFEDLVEENRLLREELGQPFQVGSIPSLCLPACCDEQSRHRSGSTESSHGELVVGPLATLKDSSGGSLQAGSAGHRTPLPDARHEIGSATALAPSLGSTAGQAQIAPLAPQAPQVWQAPQALQAAQGLQAPQAAQAPQLQRMLLPAGITSRTASEIGRSTSLRSLPTARPSSRSVLTPSYQVSLPVWFIGKDAKQNISTADILENTILHSCSPPPTDMGVLSPVSKVRLAWDATVATLLCCDIWMSLVDGLFFLDSRPPAVFEMLRAFVTAFLLLDILLNFNTGYIDKEGMLVLTRRKLIINYLKCWFWLDLLATFPFDIFGDVGRFGGSFGGTFGRILRFGRFGKLAKVLRHVRYFKIVRALKIARRSVSDTTNRCNWLLPLLGPLQYLVVGAQVLVCLGVISHFLACLWAVARLNDSLYRQEDPFNRYFESFWWAFVNISGGVLGVPSWTTGPELWALDILVVCVRLGLLTFAARVCMSQALARDYAQHGKRDRALQYLRAHKVRFAPQLQILQCIHETGQVRKLQKAFNELMSNEMPPTVRGMVSEELWASRLLSFQPLRLLNRWDPSVIRDLALSVREEVLASKVVVCKEGDRSSSAFNIIYGAVAQSSSRNDEVSDFTDGMWLGETSFFNPLLLRSGSIVTLKLTALMVVSAEAFQAILEKHGLVERWHEYCKKNLWKGLCARCGCIGDHWSDACPQPNDRSSILHFEKLTSSEFQEVPRLAMARTASRKKRNAGVSGDLKQFVACHGLQFLMPFFQELELLSLDMLEAADIEWVNAFFRERLQGAERAIFETHAFTREKFTEFRNAAEMSVSELLHFGTFRAQHLVFLSHYKAEAGTEAALILSDIDVLIADNPAHVGHLFDSPVFLDTENLRNLQQLEEHVHRSHNLVLLLTENLLTRAWCLVEIVMAVRGKTPLLPVLIQKPDQDPFQFPDKDFYAQLANGTMLDDESVKLLRQRDIEIEEVAMCIKQVFNNIALPYAPHQAASVRQAQLEAIIRNCCLKKDRDSRPA